MMQVHVNTCKTRTEAKQHTYIQSANANFSSIHDLENTVKKKGKINLTEEEKHKDTLVTFLHVLLSNTHRSYLPKFCEGLHLCSAAFLSTHVVAERGSLPLARIQFTTVFFLFEQDLLLLTL